MDGAGMSPEAKILAAATVYVGVRFGLAWLFKRMTVHRGMFHSIPAALIAAEIVFLAHDCHEQFGRLTLAGGVFLGYMSHLVLDEIWAIDANGLIPRANKAAGSACKLFSQSIPATLATWSVLAVLTYTLGVEQGFVKGVHLPVDTSTVLKKASNARG